MRAEAGAPILLCFSVSVYSPGEPSIDPSWDFLIHNRRVGRVILSEGDAIFRLPIVLRRTFSYRRSRFDILRLPVRSHGKHTFRHTFRTLLDETGAPMKVQQELMRHADIRTTMNVYGKAMDESKRAAHGKVVRLVLPSKVA